MKILAIIALLFSSAASAEPVNVNTPPKTGDGVIDQRTIMPPPEPKVERCTLQSVTDSWTVTLSKADVVAFVSIAQDAPMTNAQRTVFMSRLGGKIGADLEAWCAAHHSK
jgi:hypothetical protein